LSPPRHHQGYQSIRMLARESSKTPGKNLYLCFVEFDNAHQATACMNQMQGYKVDKGVEGVGIKISFAKAKSQRSEKPPARAVGAPPRSSDLEDRSRESERHDNRDSAEREYRDYRRDGREHRDSYRDDYEDSERGDDDYKDHHGGLDSSMQSDD